MQRTISLQIKLKKAFARMSTAQIRCPAPSKTVKWNKISIERDIEKLSLYFKANGVDIVSSGGVNTFPIDRFLLSNATSKVPVCRINSYHQEYLYTLSVCTATARHSRAHMVEGLEFHLLQGNTRRILLSFAEVNGLILFFYALCLCRR